MIGKPEHRAACMLPRIAIAALAVVAAAGRARPRDTGVPDGYTLVWSDEFEGHGHPDPTKWQFDTEANRTGWYNNERQYYAARRVENAVRTDGRLLITARRETLSGEPDHGGQRYTSARLITRGKAAWTYGFFEIRAKLPCGAGSWPAIWMLAADERWPDGGEIDIMEHVGNDPGRIYSTVHNRATVGTSGHGGSLALPSACSAFHRYQLEWTPDALRFAVDGRTTHTYAKADAARGGWPFDRPQYLLLNLAVGGDMGGKVDDAAFPQVFAVDYVRVYRRR